MTISAPGVHRCIWESILHTFYNHLHVHLLQVIFRIYCAPKPATDRVTLPVDVVYVRVEMCSAMMHALRNVACTTSLPHNLHPSRLKLSSFAIRRGVAGTVYGRRMRSVSMRGRYGVRQCALREGVRNVRKVWSRRERHRYSGNLCAL